MGMRLDGALTLRILVDVDKLRVLVVDDDPRTIQAVSTLCRSAGHDMLATASGAGLPALALKFRPTLIVLALELPDADGRDVLRDFKKDPRVADIPVLVCSDRDYASDRAISLEQGATDHVATNAWSLRHVLARIEELLGEARRGRA
jgi:two-component system, OmpR family, response regulator